MDQLNSEILRQFECQGLTINEGIAIDADWYNLPADLSPIRNFTQLNKIRVFF